MLCHPVISVQACRGKRYDEEEPELGEGAEDLSDYDDEEQEGESEVDRIARIEQDRQFLEDNEIYKTMFKHKKDFLVMLASREGCVSWRNRRQGAYMLRSLCHEIRMSTIFDNLPDVMQKAKRRTYRLVKKHKGEIQVPQIITTLRGKLCIKRYEPIHVRYSVRVLYGREPWPPQRNFVHVGVTAQEFIDMKSSFEAAKRILDRKGISLEALPNERST